MVPQIKFKNNKAFREQVCLLYMNLMWIMKLKILNGVNNLSIRKYFIGNIQ